MKNIEIKNKVLKEIRQSKLKAEAVADHNLETALKNEFFKTLYQQIKQLKFDIAKKEFLNRATAIDKKQLAECNLKMNDLIKKMGYQKSQFIPQYSCKKCHDTALNGDNYCECFYKKMNIEVINNLGVNVDKSHTFSNAKFDCFDDPKAIKQLYTKIENWCENYDGTQYKNILLSGAPGVGKTFLIDCICNKLIDKSIFVNYYTSFALNDLFLKYRTSFEENKSGMLDSVLNCDVLIIDDLGSEPAFKNSEEFFYLVFNERLAKNKSTIITTNLSLEQVLAKYGERTFSRLCNKTNSLLLKIENSDLRLKRK